MEWDARRQNKNHRKETTMKKLINLDVLRKFIRGKIKEQRKLITKAFKAGVKAGERKAK